MRYAHPARPILERENDGEARALRQARARDLPAEPFEAGLSQLPLIARQAIHPDREAGGHRVPMGGAAARAHSAQHTAAPLLVALSVEVTQSSKRKATIRCFGGPIGPAVGWDPRRRLTCT